MPNVFSVKKIIEKNDCINEPARMKNRNEDGEMKERIDTYEDKTPRRSPTLVKATLLFFFAGSCSTTPVL